MPVVKILPGGTSGGFVGTRLLDYSDTPKRSTITGWTMATTRRLIAWLWSVNTDALGENGWALTLTVGFTPETSDDWHSLRKAFQERLKRRGFPQQQWLVEWTAKARPHLHMAVYGDGRLDVIALIEWLDLCEKRGWDVVAKAQHIERISGATGWLKYISKHSARGVTHYQRETPPPGWEKTGRLWGHWGDWPVELAVESTVSDRHFWRFRRLQVQYQRARMRADAYRLACDCVGYKRTRSDGLPTRVKIPETRGSHDASFFRAGVQNCKRHRLLAASKKVGFRARDRERGKFMGVSGWIPDSVAYTLLVVATDGNLSSGLYESD